MIQKALCSSVRGKAALWRWAALALVCAGLCACRAMLTPLDPQGVQSAREGGVAEPVLLRIAACWAGLPLAEELATAFVGSEESLSYDITPTSSAIAASLVAVGRADLALVEEGFDATTGTPGGGAALGGERPAIIALNAVGVVVAQESPLRRLTQAELARVFAGQVLDWTELRAGSGRVEIVSQETGTLARSVFERHIMGREPISSAAVLVPHDRGVVEYVAQHPRAIGYASTAHVDERVKLIALDDVLPAPSEVRRGRYPLAYPLVMIVAPDAPREAAALFALASSDQGRRIIEKRYILP